MLCLNWFHSTAGEVGSQWNRMIAKSILSADPVWISPASLKQTLHSWSSSSNPRALYCVELHQLSWDEHMKLHLVWLSKESWDKTSLSRWWWSKVHSTNGTSSLSRLPLLILLDKHPILSKVLVGSQPCFRIGLIDFEPSSKRSVHGSVRGHLRVPTSPMEYVRLTTLDKLCLADTLYIPPHCWRPHHSSLIVSPSRPPLTNQTQPRT